MTVNELIRLLQQEHGNSEVQVSIYNPRGAPVFGVTDDVVSDGEDVFISVPSVDDDTLPANVYVVLAMNFPVVFVNEIDACDFANISGNAPVHTCALRTREDAAELISEFTEDDTDTDASDTAYDEARRRQREREAAEGPADEGEDR